MKVAFVTTYPPMECGIGIYVQKLARAMVAGNDDISVFIIGEKGAANRSESGITSQSVYSRNEDYGDKIFNVAVENKIELIHFQHAPDLFGMDNRLPDLLARLKKARIKTVVTLHTVYDRPNWRENIERLIWRDGKKLNDADFHRSIAQHADKLIVHQRKGSVDILLSQKIAAEKISVIAHGTTKMKLNNSRDSKLHLGLTEDSFIFLFLGFIHVQKNVHTVISAFLKIAHKYPNARLLVAGKPWGNRFYNRWYINYMKARVRLWGKGQQIFIRDGYVPSEDVTAYFSAADVLLLPHWQKYGSASGVFHQAIGSAKPVIVADGPKFSDGVELLKKADMGGLTPPPHKPAMWAQAMKLLMDDPELYKKAGTILSDYAENSLWPKVADSHQNIYRRLLKSDKTNNR
jgi:glycosyltransferase involved in cell wall biosynthesis